MKSGVVIILYHPDIPHLTAVLDVLKERALPVVLVDNSADKLDLPLSAQFEYLHYPQNIGIAAAQNYGIRSLKDKGCEAVYIFDQDSEISLALLADLAKGLVRANRVFGRVAAVGPQVFCHFESTAVTPRIQKAFSVNHNMADVPQIIASGMLLSTRCFDDIGGKDESLFIDGVDHEWCWRARKRGYHVIKLLDVLMPHKQGEGRKRVVGIVFKVGAPIRLYYQARNVLLLSRRSYVPFYWKMRNLLALPVRWLVNRFYFCNGKMRSTYFLKGLLHGIQGKCGKLTD
ncbi:glycosyltransferase family 2 protein [Aestuariibacter sp. A3R04]|uniref:glycosyltransferase family 2 protein n=1 Tax=Aestuariibacter sp. A3R04 TaxID=2841571 RepID=UPI001C09C08E|nr:glycosyltransferase family 2 protein [Aestuariibacter sp. A3R04]MBU3022098.1 glycosyltransferase family 2 protein [Aestuariibacter sp. A3R04]